MKNTVLLVVDMQKGFLNAHSSHILPVVVNLVEECRKFRIPLVYSKFVNPSGSQFEKLLEWKELASAPTTDISDELSHFERVEITKNFYSSITDAMKNLIIANDWQTVLMCGISTESCVLKSAVDVFELDLRPIVVSDACASDLGEESHQAGLHVLQIMIGTKQIVTTEGLSDLLGRQ